MSDHQPEAEGFISEGPNDIDHEARFTRSEIAAFIRSALAGYKERGDPTPEETRAYELMAKTFFHYPAATIRMLGPVSVRAEQDRARVRREHPTAPSDATMLRILAQQILDGGAKGPVWALCNGVKALAYEATLESTDTHLQRGGHDEDDDRDVRRRDNEQEGETDRVDPAGVP